VDRLTKIEWNLRHACWLGSHRFRVRSALVGMDVTQEKPVKVRTEAQMERHGESFRLPFFVRRVLQAEHGSACDRG
jgi:hypothetical protein